MRIIGLSACLIGIAVSFGVGAVYSVGPGEAHSNIGDVPWESLSAGDTVLIHWRSTPYREKWVINRSGTSTAPVVVRGVPSPSEELPIIDGEDATTRIALDYWGETRGVVKIGGASYPDTDVPEYIVVENLEIRNALPSNSFTDDGGSTHNYDDNASAIYVERGSHVIISGCEFYNCGNGLFCAHQTTDLVVEYCHIHGNGIVGDFYEHNNYTEAFGILFQFNHFGPLRDGCDGNNLKDRSAGTIVRYNWIEDGNRQLDLVDSDYADFYDDTLYRKTFVYGNILVEGEGEGNSQIIHYGGDSGDETRYRKGTLFLHNNTIVSTRASNTTLVRLSTNDESCDARNNILYNTAGGAYMAILNQAGTIDLRNNWLPSGWVDAHSPLTGTVNDFGNVEGVSPGFVDFGAQHFELAAGSPCIDAGGELAPEIALVHAPEMEYIRHCMSRPRPVDDTLDIGAYEFDSGTAVGERRLPEAFEISTYPNPFNSSIKISVEQTFLSVQNAGQTGTSGLPMEIEIFDMNGRRVEKIADNNVIPDSDRESRGVAENLNSRFYPNGNLSGHGNANLVEYVWRPDEAITSGVYLVRASIGGCESVARMVYLK